jgi:LPXTG-motif cell wall-anchored protein
MELLNVIDLNPQTGVVIWGSIIAAGAAFAILIVMTIISKKRKK